MNRLVITMNENGDIADIHSEEPITVYINCPHVPNDRVYEMQVETGADKVREAIGGYEIGHSDDDIMGPKPALPRYLQ